MNTATNFEILLNGARGIAEFDRELRRAASESVAEEHDASDAITALEYADGSRLEVSVEAQSATVAGASRGD